MKDIGSGKLTFFTPNGTKEQYKGEIVIRKDRVALTEFIYFNGQANGSREMNFPIAQCVISWDPEVYEEIGFE